MESTQSRTGRIVPPAPGATARRFSDVSAVEAEAPGRLNATIDPDWTIGGKPNGGYLLAMLGRAAASVSPHPDILSASAYYLQAPQPGRVTLDAQLLRRGRSASQVRAWLSQDDQVCVEALF